MKFTKENIEEIKKIAKEVYREMGGDSVSKADKAKYPDWDKWKENAIDTGCGLLLAPEDYHKGGKEYFTFNEALEEEKEMKKHGWRLPTRQEWEKIVVFNCYKDGVKSSKALRDNLRLGLKGYVKYDEIDDYNKNPKEFIDYGRLFNLGSYGFWWSNTIGKEENAYNLLILEDGVYADDYYNMYYGFPLRCVSDGLSEKKEE